MTKRNHIVLLLTPAAIIVAGFAGYAFADKQHAARVEKTVQLKDITHFEGVKLCNPGPQCPKPWKLSVRAPYTFDTGEATDDVVNAPEDDDVAEPNVELIEALLQDSLDGDETRKGVNKQRGHVNGQVTPP